MRLIMNLLLSKGTERMLAPTFKRAGGHAPAAGLMRRCHFIPDTIPSPLPISIRLLDKTQGNMPLLQQAIAPRALAEDARSLYRSGRPGRAGTRSRFFARPKYPVTPLFFSLAVSLHSSFSLLSCCLLRLLVNKTPKMSKPEWKPLNVAICGAGISGLAAAVALRREGEGDSASLTCLSAVHQNPRRPHTHMDIRSPN